MHKFRSAMAAASLAAVGVLTASPASADEIQYLNTMHDLGFYHPDGDGVLLHFGYATCSALNRGIPAEAIANYVHKISDASIDYTSATDEVLLAAHQLCTPAV